MRKINRRDYLLKMGVGAAALVAGSELPVLGQRKGTPSNRRQNQTAGARSAIRTPFLKWPVTDDPPNRKAFITVVYAGLSCFVYNDRDPDNKFVHVAFHHGNGGHKLQIQVYKDPPDNVADCMDPEIIPSKNSDRLSFSGLTAGTANVFQADSKYFDRNTTDDKYKYDFRWMPDLHSPDFYPEAYGLRGVTGARLAVPAGTFYTRVRTKSTFWLVDRRDCNVEIRDYGHIALYMATAIETANNVALVAQSGPPLYKFEHPHKYQLVFYNECERCSPDPTDCDDEEKRNDFHYNRDVVRVPALGRLKYSLKVKDRCAGDDCADPDFCIRFHGAHRLNDEAPCSGTGYGKAPGYP